MLLNKKVTLKETPKNNAMLKVLLKRYKQHEKTCKEKGPVVSNVEFVRMMECLDILREIKEEGIWDLHLHKIEREQG